MLEQFRFWVFCCAAMLIGFSGPVTAQATSAATQAEAEAALVGGNPARTVILANQLLEDNPDSFAALFLLALAQSDLDLPREAAASAGRAYRVASSEETRLQTARLAATAHFRAKQYARSEFWFRRAANHIATEDDAEAIVRGFQRAREANPITTQYTASIAPSDNINDGSDAARLCFENLDGTCFIELDLREDQLALSGLEYNGSARIQYELSKTPRQTTTIGGLIFGQGVVFSDETETLLSESESEIVRDLRPSDFAAFLAQFSLEQQQADFSPLGPTRIAYNYGRYWRGGDLLVDYHDLILGQIVPFEGGRSFALESSVRQQRAQAPGLIDSTIYNLSGSYQWRFDNRDVTTLTLASKYNDASEESTFVEYRLRSDYALGRQIFQTRWSTFAEIGYRSFDEFSSTLDGRRDRFASAGVTAVFEEVSYFGFSPSMSLFASRTDSDVSFIDSSKASLSFGIASNF
ncbi:hypothetical protein SLH49_18005 [Cognatiyoonia sp. IB215446]|uniref:hypothetical protein n=1 Tax=Cognatiyoonia sp. IB215446 TaxID=3097355 RepID=UPI002A17CE73|nr:hypothetical protein [Cognatiyoonia sp. IB215446]MDX8349885.1 hypothetical protein [Cognatiyoonia sp. IB215446]